jgi:hypothetical protein
MTKATNQMKFKAAALALTVLSLAPGAAQAQQTPSYGPHVQVQPQQPPVYIPYDQLQRRYPQQQQPGYPGYYPQQPGYGVPQGPVYATNEDALLGNCGVIYNNGSIVNYECSVGAAMQLPPADTSGPVCQITRGSRARDFFVQYACQQYPGATRNGYNPRRDDTRDDYYRRDNGRNERRGPGFNN